MRWSGVRHLLPAAALCVAIPLAGARAHAGAAAWVKLLPPAFAGDPVHDTRRDRELFIDPAGIVALPDTPHAQWARIWSGTPPLAAPGFAFYDSLRDRIWSVSDVLTDTLQIWTLDLAANPVAWTRQAWTTAAPFPHPTVFFQPAFACDPLRDRI